VGLLRVTLAALAFVATAAGAAPVCSHTVVRTYPHDPDAWTQGLLYRDGFLYESTGIQGRSTLRKVRLETGEVLRQLPVDERYYAEGLEEFRGRLYQLTWQSGVAFVYDFATFKRIATHKVRGEGWGLAHDGKRLILSDGSATLRLLDPQTFKEIGSIAVTADGVPLKDLNELEFVRGEIWANVWHTDRIARISPQTGKVTSWVDLAGLLPDAERSHFEAVLNGIAYDAKGDRLFVTGKLWPRLFEIKVGECR
jgi:glutamine cyclotransferase